MSKLPPIEELTIRKANQLMCADYLRTVADLIEKGAVSALEFAWNDSFRKPEGRLSVSSNFLITPVEAEFETKLAKYSAEQEAKNMVVDVSQQLKDQDVEPEHGKN